MWLTSSGRRGNHLHNFLSLPHWVIFFFLSHQSDLALKCRSSSKPGSRQCRDLPSDNDASLLAVNHYISIRAGHSNGQPSRQLLGTLQHRGHANQAHVPGKSGLNLTTVFAMAAERSVAEKPASDTISNIGWCWWSRKPTSYSSNVPNESLRSVINLPLCCDSSCTTIIYYTIIHFVEQLKC